MDAGFLTVVEIGQYFMTKDTVEFSQFTDAVTCREYTLPRDEEASQPKGWIEGIPKLAPCWKLQPVACTVSTELRSELCLCKQRQFSLLGQNFSWLKQVGHEFEQQWAGNLRNAVRRICVKIECEWFCMPVKGQSKTTNTRTCRFFHKNNTYWKKNLDRCWTRRIFNLRLCSVEEIDSSSSSWKSTQRKWWSDWILENHRRSPETFLVLSSLVWRQVEEKHGRRRRKLEKKPILYWIIRSNLVPRSSSRPFRTQSHWSFITWQKY